MMSLAAKRLCDPAEHKAGEEQSLFDAYHEALSSLLHDAYHDALTGLPNRTLFMDHLEVAIALTKRREDYLFAALFLDLDHFKVINDSLGHTVGDRLLIAIARRLKTALRPGDVAARLGGDEFIILLNNLETEADAVEMAERIQSKLSLPFNIDGHEIFSSASIGITLITARYDHAGDILRDADTAMYYAKAKGKAQHQVFDKVMHERALLRLRLETDLRRAIEREEFCIHYQPIISLETGGVSGFEALVRWQHPKHGLTFPSLFLPVAEETGLIGPIDRWVLRESCRQMSRWQKQFPTNASLSISVNLSGKNFTQPDLVAHVQGVLRETGLDPRLLELEITESVVLENIETATKMLTELRELGVQITTDDFGTGYSSLSYLHRFPINKLKIDRSFVSQMEASGGHGEIVRTIVLLARNLGMDVVAEGVETEEQMTQLKALKCDYKQGYFFSEPLDSEAATVLLQSV